MSLSRKPTYGAFESPWENDDERAERLDAERLARRQQEVSAAHGMHPEAFARETLTRRQLAAEVGEAMGAHGRPTTPVPLSEDDFDRLGEVAVEALDAEYPRS
jgi:hypothetical protein